MTSDRTELIERHRLTQQRERLQWAILRQWRQAGRHDYTDAELASEIDRRLAQAEQQRQHPPQQLELPLGHDPSEASRLAKRDAYHATRETRIGRRGQVLELLEAAGARGLTRPELAERLGCHPSDLGAPVGYLITAGLVDQPGTMRTGSTGRAQAVVVLSRYAGRATG